MQLQAILRKHNANTPGFRVGDQRLMDELIRALGVQGGTVWDLLRLARSRVREAGKQCATLCLRGGKVCAVGCTYRSWECSRGLG